MAPREGWIKWKKSRAKIIILGDLQTGILPIDPGEMSAAEAWEVCYRNMAEFNDVVFSQFEERLRDH